MHNGDSPSMERRAFNFRPRSKSSFLSIEDLAMKKETKTKNEDSDSDYNSPTKNKNTSNSDEKVSINNLKIVM